MKKLVFIFSIFFALYTKAQFPSSDTCYIELYGGNQIEEFRDIISVKKDSGYAALGSTSSFSYGSGDFYLVRTDYKGNTLWSRNIGTPGIDKGYSLKETWDGGFILGGFTNANTLNGDYDMYVIKTDSDGFVQWQKQYGGSDWDFLYSIASLPDSGFVFCGESYSFGNVSSDVYIVRTDKNGLVIWERNYGGVNRDCGNEILLTEDTSLAIAGYTESYGAGGRDGYFMKCDLVNGDTIFTRTFGGNLDEEFYSLAEATFSPFSLQGFVLVGYDRSFGIGPEADKDIYVVKIDSIGNFKWQDTHGNNTGDDEATCISNIAPYDFFVSGNTSNGGGGLDVDGAVVNFGGYWVYAYSSSFGGSADDNAGANMISLRNDYVIAGSTQNFTAVNGDAIIIINDSLKHNQFIRSSVSSDTLVYMKESEKFSGVSVYPNPSSGLVYLSISKQVKSISVLDGKGRQINIFNPSFNTEGVYKLDLSDLEPGIYFLRFFCADGSLSTNKIVLTGR